MYDVLAIVGGVSGCAIARELSRRSGRICVVERNEDVCTGTSKANSAIVHAGFAAEPGTRKARFKVEGSRLMAALSHELAFPYRRCGALVLCLDPADREKLQALYQRGLANGVEGLELVEGEALHRMEPALSQQAVAALYAPTSAILCPFGLTIALAENAAANGTEFRFDTQVQHIRREGDHFVVETGCGPMESRAVVNAAGVWGDVLHNQLCGDPLRITPRRGEYCLLDRKDGGLVRQTVYQLTGAMCKGVLVNPTVLGPTATEQQDRDDTATTQTGLDHAIATAGRSVPNLPMRDVITSFAGLRAHLEGGSDDFYIRESSENFFEAIGIESPGLSSAPAIGVYVAGLVAEKLGLAEKPDFIAQRRDIVHVRELPLPERQALVERDPAYGNILCRCEQISEGEIRDAIRRSPGARSLDGVKRRVRAGMGRCQGGFCGPKVMEILCRELDANGVRACVDEFYAPESMTSDGGCAYYDVVLADISDRQTREQYLRFFRDLRLTSPQTKLILLSADPLAALDVFECDPDYFVCKLEMETRLSVALRFVLRPCGGELGPCLIVGSRATRHVLSMREILYCEHAQRQTKIVMTTRTVTCSEKLNEIYRRLDPAEFVQTHCSFLVNLSYVKELRRTCVVLRSGACVPLSRANYARVRQALAQHLSHALGGERPLFTLSER